MQKLRGQIQGKKQACKVQPMPEQAFRLFKRRSFSSCDYTNKAHRLPLGELQDREMKKIFLIILLVSGCELQENKCEYQAYHNQLLACENQEGK